jgi:hypothetical protein
VPIALKPVELEQPAQQRSTELTGEMMLLLGPVEAGACRLAGVHVDADAHKLGGGNVGDLERAVPRDQVERIRDGDAETSRQMVVAAPCIAERVRARSLAERSDRLRRGNACHCLEQLGDMRAGQGEVAVAASRDDREEPAVDQPGQMVARGRCRNAGFRRQHARRQRAPVSQGHQYLCPGRLGEQGADGSQIRIGVHGAIVARDASISLEAERKFFRVGATDGCKAKAPANERDSNVQRRFRRFSRRSVVGVVVGLAFAAAAGVGLAQITSQPSTTVSAVSTSTTLSSSTNGENDFAGKSSEANDDQDFEQENSDQQSTSISVSTSTGLQTTSTIAAGTTTSSDEGVGQEKVDVCHVTGNGSSHTINIARPAVAAHVAHGDTEGACAETTTSASTTTTTTAAQTSTSATKTKKPKKPKHEHSSSHGNSSNTTSHGNSSHVSHSSSTHTSHGNSGHTSHGNSGHSSHGNSGGHGNGGGHGK